MLERDITTVLPTTRIETLAKKNLHQKRRGRKLLKHLQPLYGEKRVSNTQHLGELELVWPCERSPRPPKRMKKRSGFEWQMNHKQGKKRQPDRSEVDRKSLGKIHNGFSWNRIQRRKNRSFKFHRQHQCSQLGE